MATLALLQGNPPQKTFSLNHAECIRIGRKVPETEILVEDRNASRNHAIIIHDNGKYIVHDLHSTNGTFVNGEIIEKHVLADGDVITVGHTMLRFQGTIILPEEETTTHTTFELDPGKKGSKSNPPEVPVGV